LKKFNFNISGELVVSKAVAKLWSNYVRRQTSQFITATSCYCTVLVFFDQYGDSFLAECEKEPRPEVCLYLIN